MQVWDFKRTRLNDSCLDLFSLYKSVTAMGGWPKDNPMRLSWCQAPLAVAAQMRNWSAGDLGPQQAAKVMGCAKRCPREVLQPLQHLQLVHMPSFSVLCVTTDGLACHRMLDLA